MNRPDRDLDRALSGRSEPDEALAGLVETARALTQAFDLEPEPPIRERALFAAAVGSRGRSGSPLVRLFAPVAAGLGLVAALGFVSGTAMPGDVLYPVRKVLQDVGLNKGVLADAVARMDRAEALLDEAEDLPNDRGGRVTSLAVRAIQELAPVEDLLEEADLSAEELAGHRARLAMLIERGTSLIAANEERDGSAENDRSGPGGGDDDHGGDDRSGSGDGDADDDGDDNSGSGSGDDADDRSGSGDGDDRSGSGDGDDRSGSGSDEIDRSGSDDEEDRSGSDDDPIDSLDDELDDDSDPDDEDKLD